MEQSDILERATKSSGSLRFLRIFSPDHIPRKLIEQVKHRDFTVDEWFDHQKAVCTYVKDNEMQLNPLNLLYAIADDDNQVQGVLWCSADPLSKSLVIQTYSMMPDYWTGAQCVNLLENKAKEIRDKCNLKKIYWITNYPRHSKKHGFRPSKSVLMELKEVKNGEDIDGRIGDIQPTESTATAVLEQPSGASGA